MRVFVHENGSGLHDKFLPDHDLEGGVPATDASSTNQQTYPMEEDATNFTCGICYDEFDLTTKEGQDQANIKFLSECGHTFCGACFEEYYRTMIEVQYLHEKLKCPQFDCEVLPSMSDVKKIVDSDCMQKFKRFKRDTMVARDKNLIFCSKPNCDTILNKQINSDKKKQNKLSCPECKSFTCYLCKQEYEPERLHDKRKCLDST